MSSGAHDRLKQHQREELIVGGPSVERPSGPFLSSHVSPSRSPHPSGAALPFPDGAVQLRTISYLVYRNVSILIHDVQDPEQSEWERSLAYVEPLLKKDVLQGVLVRSFGGGPTPYQRRQIIEVFKGKDMPVANVSDSAVTRAITTALSWFYRGSMRSYSPRDLRKAALYLGVPEVDVEDFLEKVFALCLHRGRQPM
jgi:hypothetical protein